MKFWSKRCRRIAAASLCIVAVTLTSGCSSKGSPAPDSGSSGEQSAAENVKLLDWMQEKLDSGEPVTEKEQGKWQNKATQEEYLAAWMQLAGEQALAIEETGNGDFLQTSQRLNSLKELYVSVYPEEDIDDFSSALADLDAAAQELDVISQRYSVPLDDLEFMGSCGDFLVLYRLDSTYEESIDGALQQGLDYLLPEEGSNWYATDPYGTYEYVLHADEPFREQGLYSLAYMDNGVTIPLVDSMGFQTDTPVYQVIGDADQLEADEEAYSWAKGSFDKNWLAIRWLLAPETFDHIHTEKGAALNFCGEYTNEFGSSVSVSALEDAMAAMESGMEMSFLYDIGTVWPGDGSASSTMYLLGKNLYLNVSDYGQAGIVGIYQENGVTKAHYYGPGYEEIWTMN